MKEIIYIPGRRKKKKLKVAAYCRVSTKEESQHSSKSLTEEEKLRLLVEKLEIENERLKKGYIVKGVGADKVFVTLRELNSK